MSRTPILDTSSLPTKVGIQNASYTYAADAGASDAYAITLSPAPTAYAAGQRFSFYANTANTGAASLNVNALGAKTIKKLNDQDLATGDIEAGQIVEVVYNGTDDVMEMVSTLADVTGSVSAASETVAGKVELATDAEVATGTDTARAVTPAGASATYLKKSGGAMTGSITLGEGTAVVLDPAGSADGAWSGIAIVQTSGYSQAFGDLVYKDPTDSRWEAVDVNAASAADGDARGTLGIVVSAGTDGNACIILLWGMVRADAKFPAMTINAPMYASETAGAITGTIPTTTDAVQRVVGFALTADEILFAPNSMYQTAV